MDFQEIQDYLKDQEKIDLAAYHRKLRRSKASTSSMVNTAGATPNATHWSQPHGEHAVGTDEAEAVIADVVDEQAEETSRSDSVEIDETTPIQK